MPKDEKKTFLRKTFEGDLKKSEYSDLSRKIELRRIFDDEINPNRDKLKRRKRKKGKRKLIMLSAIILAIALLLGMLSSYFLYISPIFVSKPYVEKPFLRADEPVISSEHIAYLLNEVSTYKLHRSPIGEGPAQLEVFVSDINKRFTVTVTDNAVSVIMGAAPDPDLRLTTTEETVLRLFDAEDVAVSAKYFVELKDISIETLHSEALLATKGYKAMYDTLTKTKIGGRSLIYMTRGMKKILYILAVLIVTILTLLYLIYYK